MEYYIIYGERNLLAKFTTEKDTFNQNRNIAKIFDTEEKLMIYLLEKRHYTLYMANKLINMLTNQKVDNWTSI